jgi:putative membrane protein
MSRIATMSLLALVMMASLAFASPIQQSDKQSSPMKQDKSSPSMTKSDKIDQSTPTNPPTDTATKPAMNPSPTTISGEDNKFVIEAAHGNMMEVNLARTALDKSTNPDVKQFAQRMIDDHSKANTELQQLATQKGITLPATDVALTDEGTGQSTDQTMTDTNERHARVDTHSKGLKEQSEMNKLAGLSGADFDRAYVNMMVKDHEKDVKEFEKASAKAKDPDVRAWATSTLPTLRDHLQQIRDIQSRMK